jgi:dihydrofolate reductase
MRSVLYGAACSLDGFIAGDNDEVEWLHWSDDVARISGEVWSTTDTVLMGRRTYEIAVQNGMDAYPGVQNIVFSRTLALSKPIPDLTIVRDDAAGFVRDLKEQEGRGICVMGGGRLAGSLLAAGLIDEVGVNIHPVLLGTGIPLFPAGDYRAHLTLTDSRPIKRGCFYARYRVDQ